MKRLSWHKHAARALALITGLMGFARAQSPVEHNIPYGPDPAQMLDFYRPENTHGAARLVVFLHGGGWVHGNKGVGHNIAPPIVRQGYAFASIGYRLAPQAPPATGVQDAAQGIAYLLNNAGRFGIDPSRFAIIGHSSGAHMVALLGTDAGYMRRAGIDPNKLAAVITLDGVFDVAANLEHFPNETKEEVFGHDPAAWKAVSPVDLLATTTIHPLFCLIHEDRNRRFVEQEAIFEHALRQRGAAVRGLVASGYTHGELVKEFANPQAPMAEFALGCLHDTLGR